MAGLPAVSQQQANHHAAIDCDSEDRFRLMADAAPVLIWVAGTDKLCYFFNKPWLEFTGRTHAQEEGNGWAECVHPDDMQRCLQIYTTSFDARQPFTMEYRLRHRDGSWRWLLDNGVPRFLPDGAFAGYIGSCVDITERKEADDQVLQASEERYQRLFNSMNSGFAVHEVICDSLGNPIDYRFLNVNPAFEVFTGLKADLVQGRTVREVLPGIDDAWIVLMGRVGLGHGPVHAERQDPILDRWYDVVAYSPEAGHFATLFTDITDRKRAEQVLREAKAAAEAASEAKALFLANMSHEIRTPMNGVIGMTGLLLDTELDEHQHQCADIIRSSGHALLDVIDEILDFSKIEAGRLTLERTEFDLRKLLEAASETLALRAHEKGLWLSLVISPAVPHLTTGDPSRLRQVVTNLLGNAIKFTMHGEVVLRVGIAGYEDGLVHLRFQVQDTGVGIPPEARQRIFTPFEQVDSSTTRCFGGTGLGLSISRRLVELMGGLLVLDEPSGPGSSFSWTIALPFRDEHRPTIDAGCMRGADVLVVGGPAGHQESMAMHLQGLNCSSIACHDAQDALQRLRSGPPVLAILVDGRSDDDLACALRSDPALSGIHLIHLVPLGHPGPPDAHTLSLPVRHAALRQVLTMSMRTSAVPQDRPGRLPTSLRVLLVEDDPINQTVARTILTARGAQVTVVGDGDAALQVLATDCFSAVLMDCQMPVMDGYRTTQAIRNGEGGVRDPQVPIIAMTACALTGDRERCLMAGMNDYISKPVHADDLIHILHRWTQDRTTTA
jgi:two-component system, sensor histidine kinase and response regulator